MLPHLSSYLYNLVPRIDISGNYKKESNQKKIYMTIETVFVATEKPVRRLFSKM